MGGTVGPALLPKAFNLRQLDPTNEESGPLVLNTETSLGGMNMSARLVDLVTLTTDELKQVSASFGFTRSGEPTLLGEGRIASNVMCTTKEHGNIVIRVYPGTYGKSKLAFEAEALNHAAENGLPVPKPLQLVANLTRASSSSFVAELPGKYVLIYKAIEGSTIDHDELSPKIASQAGQLLAKHLESAVAFEPRSARLEGDMQFIAGLLRARREANADFAALPCVNQMEELLINPDFRTALDRTPDGLVHADYFFENVLQDEQGNFTGLIDFGDAYYGKVLNDVVIGAAEFSIDQDDNWNLESFRSFVIECAPFLRKSSATSGLCIDLLSANCVRFAVYTLPLIPRPAAENPYVKRFEKLQEPEFRQAIKHIFDDAIQV